MDALKEIHEKYGDDIPSIIQPVSALYTKVLSPKRDEIYKIRRVEKSYGPHPRQKLDIYYPQKEDSNGPYLVFLYGGGLIRGEKLFEHGLIYHNLGSFFANRGFTTIIPDYRRVNSAFGGEDAVFPSGAEDLSLALKLVEGLSPNEKRHLFTMGTSAGGVHMTTFMLEPRFRDQRQHLMSGEGPLIWKGAVELQEPFHFGSAVAMRNEVVKNYYGSDSQTLSPYGLLQAVQKEGKSREETYVPLVLTMVGEYDPPEITKPVEDFVQLRKTMWKDSVESRLLPGHNHLSPVNSLMCGDAEVEKWAEDVTAWFEEQRTIEKA